MEKREFVEMETFHSGLHPVFFLIAVASHFFVALRLVLLAGWYFEGNALRSNFLGRARRRFLVVRNSSDDLAGGRLPVPLVED
jgi:hypothetical protein